MAPVHSVRQVNGFEPPPSSILATHVVNGNGVPDLDRDNFNQLLTEVLGSNDQEQPNLGADITVNHKLICIIFQVGIEPVLEDNPFKASSSSTTTGKADAQLQNCLDALRLAIEKSPQVLFVKSNAGNGGHVDQSLPLYTWLVPRLLPLIAVFQNAHGRSAVLAVLETMLDANMKCSPLKSSEDLLQYIRASISGELSQHLECNYFTDNPSYTYACHRCSPSQARGH
jgi:hypothetical protein